ncbi:hypothetical protein [Hyphobacterium sp.]|uniref:hypothetical protein n=1 Tax=Hyphobacterium sp. TaxID=2004662 RepID=UPI003748F55D
MMKSFAKILSAAGFLSLAAFAAPAANAGVWHLDARSCPDLREDRRDARYNEGRFDRREDRRDMRVIDCPPRSWTYVADRYERRNGIQRGSGGRRGTPGIVYTNGYNQFYRIARNGRYVPIQIVVNNRGGGHYNRPHRGSGYGYGPRPRRHNY